jgi:hypothetical protein
LEAELKALSLIAVTFGSPQLASLRLMYIFIVIRTMPASVAATISSFEMISFGQHDKALPGIIKINSFS